MLICIYGNGIEIRYIWYIYSDINIRVWCARRQLQVLLLSLLLLRLLCFGRGKYLQRDRCECSKEVKIK